MATKAERIMVEQRLSQMGITGRPGKYKYKGRKFKTAKDAYDFAKADQTKLTNGLTGNKPAAPATVNSQNVESAIARLNHGATKEGLLENLEQSRKINAANSSIFPIKDGKAYGEMLTNNKSVEIPKAEKVKLPEGYSGILKPQKVKPAPIEQVPENINQPQNAKLPEGHSGIRRTPKINTEGIKYNPKNEQGFFGKIGNFFKGKKGKVALAVTSTLGAIGLITAGVALFSGKDKEVKNDQPAQKTEQKAAQETAPKAAEQVKQDQTAEQVTNNPEPAANEKVTDFKLDENGQYTVKKGDNVWNIAKAYLESKLSETPTDRQVYAEVERIMSINPDLKYRPKGDIEKYFVDIFPDQKILIEKKIDVKS